MKSVKNPRDADPKQPLILVVDNTPGSHAWVQHLLEDLYSVQGADTGAEMLAIAQSQTPPDLILLSSSLPDGDGFALCRTLKTDTKTRQIPVILLTLDVGAVDDHALFVAGAADYIAKPLSPPTLRARVKTHLALKGAADFLADRSAFLQNEIAARTREVNAVQDVTILAMALLAETRDADTGNHIRRTQLYVRALGWKLSNHPRFKNYLTVANIALLFKAAPLHDIGKVAIPDRVLQKPGKLTAEEFEIMKTHTTLGRDAIAQAEQELGVEVPFLSMAMEIAHCHQEKWDGSGYPQGLVAEQIPIPARLMAVADVYDALISRRIYREAMSHAEAVKVIEHVKGKHFDPDVVDAFLDIHEQFNAIAMSYHDSDADLQKKADYLELSRYSAPGELS